MEIICSKMRGRVVSAYDRRLKSKLKTVTRLRESFKICIVSKVYLLLFAIIAHELLKVGVT